MKSISYLCSSLVGGGAERVMSELYNNTPDNVSSTFCIYRNIVEYEVNRDNLIIFDKTSIHTKPLSTCLHYINGFIQYRKYIHEKCPDISVSFLTPPNLINVLSCIFTKTKCITSLRHNPKYSQKFFDRIVLRLSFSLERHLADGIIVNSEDIKQLLITKYHFPPKKVRCIYNPKNVQQIQERKLQEVDDAFFNADDPILLVTGRLDAQKGLVHLIRVFAELRKQYSCKLAICGKGILETELKALANDLNLDNTIKFLGWCENPYMYMNASDIFVMSSIYEGQPNALIEALICSCPCVSTDCESGPREILEDGKYGLLTMKLPGKVENPTTAPLSVAEQDLYDKLEMFITNPELRKEYADRAKEVWWKFDNEKIIKEYYDAFDEF